LRKNGPLSKKTSPVSIKNGPACKKNGPVSIKKRDNLRPKIPITKPFLTSDQKEEIYVKIGYSGYDYGINVLLNKDPLNLTEIFYVFFIHFKPFPSSDTKNVNKGGFEATKL